MSSIRLTRLLLIAISLVASLIAPPGAARSSQVPGVASLPLTDADGVPVIGIVCDNLPDTPAVQRDRLFIPLSANLRNVPLAFFLADFDADFDADFHQEKRSKKRLQAKRQKGRKKRERIPLQHEVVTNAPLASAGHLAGSSQLPAQRDNLGEIVREGDRLIYTPPDEFNRNADPQHLRDIDHAARRTVLLTVRRADADGTTPVVAQQAIILARPPVVLVHGINTNAGSEEWIGKGRIPGKLPGWGFTTVLVNHGQNDYDFRHPLDRAAQDFLGNGPVEIASNRLAATVANTLLATRQRDHLAIRRVDLIGYSYGGVICRWYLHGFRRDPRVRNSLQWYVHSTNIAGKRGMYTIDPARYAQKGEGRREQAEEENRFSAFSLLPSPFQNVSVRKCLTIASMWRGVPLCNYVNELHESPLNGPRLADAPLLGGTLGQFVDGPLAELLPTRVPAMEVMAVNSPWLDALDNYQEAGQRKPFLDEVAYGCVAGDDNAFLELPGTPNSLLDPYSVLRIAQVPSWFPYLALERHDGSDANYSDGLVPLWSALFTNDFGGLHPSRIVHANHDTILADKQAYEYVLCALSSHNWLPTGRTLNDRWGLPIQSRELLPYMDTDVQQNSPIPAFALNAPALIAPSERTRRTWRFRPGQTAPSVQNALYPQVNLLGRIAPAALREIREVRINHITQTSAEVFWRTAASLNGSIRVTEWQPVNFAAYEERDVDCRIETLGYRVGQEHRFRVSGLQPNTSYQIIATSEVTEDPDNSVAVRSENVHFTTDIRKR